MNSRENKYLELCPDRIHDLLIWIGSDGSLLHANSTALRFYGYELDSFTQLSIHDIDTNFPASAWGQHWESLKRNKFLTVTVQHKDKSGCWHTVEIIDNYQEVNDAEFSICVIRPLSHRDERHRRIHLMEFSLDSMEDSALWLNSEGHIIFANDATCRNFDYAHDELMNMSIFDLAPDTTEDEWLRDWTKLRTNKHFRFETEYRCKNGNRIPVEINLNYLKSNDQEISCAFVRDVTERRHYEKQLLHIATHDALTGLPNRACLYDRLEHALLNARRTNDYCAILLVDLDDFKYINDNIGHDAGDTLLKVLSNRMSGLVRETDTVARLGGDEFVILLESIKHPDDCAVLAEKLVQSIGKPVNYTEECLLPGASIGIAVYPEDGGDVSKLLKHADLAMYQAKRQGGNQYQFYRKEMGDRIAKQMATVKGLKNALEKGHFVLYYQPVFELDTGRITSAEALIRWLDPERGLIAPGEFIAIAEESELIVSIGAWVLEEACRQYRRWLEEGLEVVPVAVNLSARQLGNMKIVADLKTLLRKYDLGANLICLELTESMMMDDPEFVNNILREFRQLGVSIAIDDFGTGYSSLKYLQQFSVDTIKIDRSFICDIADSSHDAIIANSIISLAHGLGCRVLAEGVETQIQADYLRQRRCDLVQGFLYRKPLPADEFKQLLQRSSAKAANEN